MTLIACISPEISPVYLADILASSKAGNPDLTIPSLGMYQRYVDGPKGLKIHSLERKLHLIGANGILAYAGDLALARELLKFLAQRFSGKSFSLDDFDHAFDSWPLRNAVDKKVHFILSVRNGGVSATTTNVQNEYRLSSGQLCLLGGTGANAAKHLFAISSYPRYEPQERDNLRALLSIAGTFYGEEMTRVGATLPSGFGGGYDLAYFEGDTPRMLEDYCFVVWQIEIGPPVKASIIQIHRHFVDQGITCLNCVKLDGAHGKEFYADHSVFVVSSPLDPSIEDTWKPNLPPLQTTHHLEVFGGIDIDGRHMVTCNGGFLDRRIVTFLPTKQFKVDWERFNRDIVPSFNSRA